MLAVVIVNGDLDVEDFDCCSIDWLLSVTTIVGAPTVDREDVSERVLFKLESSPVGRTTKQKYK
jgi:hypothetical protein